MTQEQYIQERLEDQITWYDKKSASNKKLHLNLRMIEIILAASIPVLSIFEDFKIVIAIIGTLLSILASASALYKPIDKWIQYRNTSEALKNEKFMYFAKSGIYDSEKAFQILVERAEFIMSKENSSWTQILSPAEGTKSN